MTRETCRKPQQMLQQSLVTLSATVLRAKRAVSNTYGTDLVALGLQMAVQHPQAEDIMIMPGRDLIWVILLRARSLLPRARLVGPLDTAHYVINPQQKSCTFNGCLDGLCFHDIGLPDPKLLHINYAT